MNVAEGRTESLYEILRGFEILRGIADEDMRELASIGNLVKFPKGEMIFREQEPAENCYLIVDGIVSLEICKPDSGCATVLTISTGELLSWSPLVGGERLTANAKALSDTVMVELNGGKLVDLCEARAEFGYRFMHCTARALAKRLTATRLQLLDLYGAESPDEPTHSGNRT